MKNLVLSFILFISSCFSDVLSTTGQIKFDTQMDGQAEMTLNTTGLGIGILPSSNLSVAGNAIVSEQLFVGGSSGSSNLNVTGTIGYGFQNVNSSTILSGNSIILADTSSGNILLSLPEAIDVSGRTYTIKKTSTLNNIFIRDGGFIDSYSDISLSVNNMGSLSVISSSGNWHILNISGNGDLIAADNLVGWWKLDDTSTTTAIDSSISERNGTINNLGSSNINLQGKLNAAMNFDGNDDTISLGDFDIPGTSMTILAWIKTSEAANQQIIRKTNTYQIIVLNPGARALFGNGSPSWSSGDAADGATNVVDGEWHFIVGVQLSNDDTLLYVDGVLDASNSGGQTLGLSNDTAYIGGVNEGSNFKGMIDDVRVYNRALTASEIQALYNQGQ